MSHFQPEAIVRGARIANKSAKGGRSYAGVRGLVQYIAYGRYADQPSFGRPARTEIAGETGVNEGRQQRGVWLDHHSQAVTHDGVRQWAKDKVHRYGYDYTYQLLLSTRHGGLTETDFNRVLQRGSGISQVLEWKYMVHEDTNNQHAHAILFSREKLTNARYKEWQQTMQAELERLQVARRQEKELAQEIALEQIAHAQPIEEKERYQGWEMEL